jgi:hypothetical protein
MGRAHCLIDSHVLPRLEAAPNITILGAPKIFEQRTTYIVEVDCDLLDDNCTGMQDVCVEGNWVSFPADQDVYLSLKEAL